MSSTTPAPRRKKPPSITSRSADGHSVVVTTSGDKAIERVVVGSFGLKPVFTGE